MNRPRAGFFASPFPGIAATLTAPDCGYRPKIARIAIRSRSRRLWQDRLPRLDLRARLSEDPFADGDDQSAALGERNKLCRRNEKKLLLIDRSAQIQVHAAALLRTRALPRSDRPRGSIRLRRRAEGRVQLRRLRQSSPRELVLR